jgi:excisionase family DNA binding protein
MTVLEELIAAVLGATESRREEALKLLRGEARLAIPLEPPPLTAPLLLNMGHAASYLGVSRTTLWRMIRSGRLEEVEVLPGSHRLRRADVEGLARKNPEETGRVLDFCQAPHKQKPLRQEEAS